MPQPKADTARRSLFKRDFARHLRANATDTERILWSLLRRRQFSGLRFRRQQPVGPYIVDFVCPSAKLIVELDGGQHGTDTARSHDDNRTRFLEQRGYRVLRFWNHEVLKNRDAVLDAIHRATVLPSP